MHINIKNLIKRKIYGLCTWRISCVYFSFT